MRNSGSSSNWGTIVDGIAGLISVGAGVYLLTKQSASVDVSGASGESWFQVIAHGMGAYFIAKGIWMWRSLSLQVNTREWLARLAEWNESRRVGEIPSSPAQVD